MGVLGDKMVPDYSNHKSFDYLHNEPPIASVNWSNPICGIRDLWVNSISDPAYTSSLGQLFLLLISHRTYPSNDREQKCRVKKRCLSHRPVKQCIFVTLYTCTHSSSREVGHVSTKERMPNSHREEHLSSWQKARMFRQIKKEKKKIHR